MWKMEQSMMDDKVTSRVVGHDDGTWSDRWEGPGGTLLVTSMTGSQFDAKVVFTPTEGPPTTDHIYEGAEYPFLEELFGADLYAEWRQHLKDQRAIR